MASVSGPRARGGPWPGRSDSRLGVSVLREMALPAPMLLLAACLLIQGTPAAGEMRLGVCCHPGYVTRMPVTWDEVFRWLTGCGADLCRIDWQADWEGNDAILAAAERAGVELLPVLFPPAPTENTEQAWYEAARRYGEECARRYRGRIRYFELSNELDCRCMTKWPNGGDRDGAAMSDYDEAKYAPIRGLLRGLAEGVRAGDPECLRLVDTAGWLHFGFVDLLVRDGVPFDILAWHWYSEMRDLAARIESYSGTYVVLDKLAGYGKPVWVTEGNARDGALGRTEDEQTEYLTSTLRRLRDTGKVDAYVVYELFDEPYLLSSGGEAYCGIVHCEWGLSEGSEFPGARGRLSPAEVADRRALVLAWDFTGGGNYVSANWLPRAPVTGDELRLVLRGPAGKLPLLLRFVDATGEHFQLTPEVELSGDWQELRFPVREPWGDRWAGNKDSVVDQPLRGVWIGVRGVGAPTGELALAAAELWAEGRCAYCFDASRDGVFAPRRAWQALRDL